MRNYTCCDHWTPKLLFSNLKMKQILILGLVVNHHGHLSHGWGGARLNLQTS
jgi:hypothetical protein